MPRYMCIFYIHGLMFSILSRPVGKITHDATVGKITHDATVGKITHNATVGKITHDAWRLLMLLTTCKFHGVTRELALSLSSRFQV